MKSIDWKRIKKALKHKNNALTYEEIDEVFSKFSKIHGLLGGYSLGRPTIIKVCDHMLRHKSIKCLVPVCPDYSHENELYTLEYVDAGVSMVAQKHIDFLKQIQEHFPVKANFLYADYEVEDDYLRNKVRLTKEEFFHRIGMSKEVCVSLVKDLGWSASLMTEVMSDIAQREAEYIEVIRKEEKHKKKIEYDTLNKEDLYNRINPNFTWEEKILRTLKYSAQYYAMGLFCVENDYLVCNHSSANLAWYIETGAGLIHNPVAIY